MPRSKSEAVEWGTDMEDQQSIPSAKESFEQSWQEILRGETLPISELWTESADMQMGKENRMWEERIVIDPKILVGKPVIRGTRLAVDFILDLLSQGWSNDEILRNYPGIELADIQACLAYARDNLRAEKVFLLAA